MFIFDYIRRGVSAAILAGFNDGIGAVSALLQESQAQREKREQPETVEGEFRELLTLPVKKGR